MRNRSLRQYIGAGIATAEAFANMMGNRQTTNLRPGRSATSRTY